MSATDPAPAPVSTEADPSTNGAPTAPPPTAKPAPAAIHPLPSTSTPASSTPSKPQPKGILVRSSSTSSQHSDSSSPSSSSASSAPSTLPSLTLAGEADVTPISSPIASHRLHRSWTFHFSLPSEKKNWDETSITPVCSVQSVEHFWFVYQSLAKPTSLPMRADVHFFLTNVQPTWEEPANHHGGRWIIEYKRGEEDVLNLAYTLTLLALIGEAFTDSDEMMGVVLSIRKGKNKLQVWTRTGSKREEAMRIGREWKEVTEYRGRIGYMTHDDSKKYSVEQKAKYEL